MSDAIEQRVERFVREILALVERVSAERRAAALGAVAEHLAETRRPTAPADARASRGAATSPRRRQGPARRPQRTPSEAPGPAPVAPASLPGAPKGSDGEAGEVAAPSGTAAPVSAPDEAAGQVPEREARVLAAVRALGQATASEVAERSGQPNGSVVVALRALVARGLVARAKTAEGVEYNVMATTAVA